MEERVSMQQDFETDSIVIKKGDKVARVPCAMVSHVAYEKACRDSMLQVGCSENDINQMYRATDGYRVGFTNPRNYTYGPDDLYGFKPVRADGKISKFPRSEEEMDAIMIRRINARLRLQREREIRRLKHAAIWFVAIVFLPPLVTTVLRLWWACLAWIAS